MRRKGIWAGVTAVILAVALGGFGWYQQEKAREMAGVPRGGPVELPSTEGDFSLAQLGEDQLAVLFFGYTYCPDVCPMSMAVVRQAMAGLDAREKERVVPVMISVDPHRDTLERLADYTDYFGDAFIGATGSEAQLADIAERYGVVWRKVETPESEMPYTIDHSSSLYLVDRQGRVLKRVLYSPTPNALISALESELNG